MIGAGRDGNEEVELGASPTGSDNPDTAWNGREVIPLEVAARPNEDGGAKKLPGRSPRSCLARLSRGSRILVKVLGIGAMLLVLTVSLFGPPGVLVSNDVAFRRIISVLFLIGLLLVALEDVVGVDKSAVMLILAASMWVFTAARYQPTHSEEGRKEFHHHLDRGLEDVGGIVLFLLPAMAVVESVDHFGGFDAVTLFINKSVGGQRHRLMPIICIMSFFMSSVIDNLTATIVALKILRHVAADDDDWRQLCGGVVVIAANAGGAWSPIGDVTTTMLWIQNKITVPSTVTSLFVPSLMAGVAPLGGLWWQAVRAARKAGGKKTSCEEKVEADEAVQVSRSSVLVLVLGICSILMVPVLKMWTGLPPYLGMLFALGMIWIATEALEVSSSDESEREPALDDPEMYAHDSSADALESPKKGRREPVGHGGVPAALHKVDLTGLLFFTGVLLAVVALDAAGVLRRYATWMMDAFGENPVILSSILGVSSAIVDNVPLVEASIDMFTNPIDAPLWQLVALAAGTGGSILSIGSIAGVTLMSMEGVGFLWYVRNVSLWALIGFVLGLATYEGQRRLLF